MARAGYKNCEGANIAREQIMVYPWYNPWCIQIHAWYMSLMQPNLKIQPMTRQVKIFRFYGHIPIDCYNSWIITVIDQRIFVIILIRWPQKILVVARLKKNLTSYRILLDTSTFCGIAWVDILESCVNPKTCVRGVCS